jgi:hypothetical protein
VGCDVVDDVSETHVSSLWSSNGNFCILAGALFHPHHSLSARPPGLMGLIGVIEELLALTELLMPSLLDSALYLLR